MEYVVIQSINLIIVLRVGEYDVESFRGGEGELCHWSRFVKSALLLENLLFLGPRLTCARSCFTTRDEPELDKAAIFLSCDPGLSSRRLRRLNMPEEAVWLIMSSSSLFASSFCWRDCTLPTRLLTWNSGGGICRERRSRLCMKALSCCCYRSSLSNSLSFSLNLSCRGVCWALSSCCGSWASCF